jgi:hypothetical protein|tara:strand:- start:121 stop:384 length:264 start_codon:yes stop_codon:yes gene_type:complete
LVGFILNDIYFPEFFSIEFHSFPKKIKSRLANLAANAHGVLFGYRTFWMDQLTRNHPILSQNQQSGGVDIEPTRDMDCGPMWRLALD